MSFLGYPSSADSLPYWDGTNWVFKTAAQTVTAGGGLLSGASAGGDLSGTLPSPTVAKINGATVPSSPVLADVGKGLTVSAAGAYGLSSAVVILEGDARLSNSRAPTSHAVTHTNGTDDIATAGSGTKGVVLPPGGTTTFLRADGSWATPAASVPTPTDVTGNYTVQSTDTTLLLKTGVLGNTITFPDTLPVGFTVRIIDTTGGISASYVLLSCSGNDRFQVTGGGSATFYFSEDYGAFTLIKTPTVIGAGKIYSFEQAACAGGGTRSDVYAHLEGSGGIATGNSAHSEGASTTASSTGAHSEGVSSIASGYGSHAEGVSAVASNYGEQARGGGTTGQESTLHLYLTLGPSGTGRLKLGSGSELVLTNKYLYSIDFTLVGYSTTPGGGPFVGTYRRHVLVLCDGTGLVTVLGSPFGVTIADIDPFGNLGASISFSSDNPTANGILHFDVGNGSTGGLFTYFYATARCSIVKHP